MENLTEVKEEHEIKVSNLFKQFAKQFARDFTPDEFFVPPVKEINSIEEMDLNPVSDLEKLAEEMEAREK